MTEGRSNTRWMLLLVLLITVISVIGWWRLQVDTSLEPLLPENSQARQTVLFLSNSSFASKAILWFQLTGDGRVEQLYAAADQAEKQLDPKLVKRVIHPPLEADAVDEAINMLNHAGELLNAQDLAEVEKATAPDALKKTMRDAYMKLTRPEGSFMLEILRKDPLGVSTRILNRLYTLTNSMGYKIDVKGGRLMHTDGRQMMLVLETSTTATSLAGANALAESLKNICDRARPGVKITPISAQIHTEENQRLMHADTRFGAVVNTIGFILLFLLVSRDWRVASVFLLPVFSIGITIGLCALVYPHLSMMMIGVSLTMAGSAVDYGIFVYTAVTMSKDPTADLRRIRRPLIISHLTTLGVFLAFLFSSIPAYRQLGWLTSISLVLSLLAALFLLPKLVRPGGKIMLLGSGMPLSRWGRMMVPTVFICGGLLLLASILSRGTRFDVDVSHLDGIGSDVRKSEADFQKTWGRSATEMGLLVVSATSREQAEEISDRLNDQSAAHLKDGQSVSPLVSMSSIWPSAATRHANWMRWESFWTPDRIRKVRADLTAAAEPYGFTTDAFDPFFNNLSAKPKEETSNQILSALEDQFTARAGNDFQILSYFPDTAENVEAMHLLTRTEPHAQVVSRRALGQAFADAAKAETRLLLTVSTVFIVIFLAVLTRSAVKSVIIMLPAFAGLIAMLAVLVVTGFSMNVVTVIAAIIVLALTSDYGVFTLYACENREPLFGQGMASVHLCALTTLVGVAAMLHAHHPALFVVGVSLTTGLLAGYATGLFVVPAVCYLVENRKVSTG